MTRTLQIYEPLGSAGATFTLNFQPHVLSLCGVYVNDVGGLDRGSAEILSPALC